MGLYALWPGIIIIGNGDEAARAYAPSVRQINRRTLFSNIIIFFFLILVSWFKSGALRPAIGTLNAPSAGSIGLLKYVSGSEFSCVTAVYEYYSVIWVIGAFVLLFLVCFSYLFLLLRGQP